MNLNLCIKHLFPNAKEDDDYLLMDSGDGPFIAKWNLSEPQPTPEELNVSWEQIKDSQPIPPLSEIDLVKKTLTDLSYDLMMNGVI